MEVSFEVRFHEDALSALGQLDKKPAQRIFSKIKWLAIHFETLPRQALSGDLTAFF